MVVNTSNCGSGGLGFKRPRCIVSLDKELYSTLSLFTHVYTAILRKVVGNSAQDNPKRYCGWFSVLSTSKKFERMAREAMDTCLRVLKERNKSKFESYSVRNSELIVSHITFRDCRMHIFSDNLPRNSCKWVPAT